MGALQLHKSFSCKDVLHDAPVGYSDYGKLIPGRAGILQPAQSAKSLILSKVLAGLADKKKEVRFIPLITFR